MQALLQHNAKVYIASRDEERTLRAIEDLKSETGKEAIFLKLDLGDLYAVKAAAVEFLRYARLYHADMHLPGTHLQNLFSKETKLDVLFNNAYAFELLGFEPLFES